MLQMVEKRGRPAKGTGEGSREGKKSLTVWVDVDMVYELKLLAVEQRVSMQELLVGILNDGLRKFGKRTFEEDKKS